MEGDWEMRKILKFGVKIIESGLSLENIMKIEELINVDGEMTSVGITSANAIFCGQDNVVETVFCCLI